MSRVRPAAGAAQAPLQQEVALAYRSPAANDNYPPARHAGNLDLRRSPALPEGRPRVWT